MGLGLLAFTKFGLLIFLANFAFGLLGPFTFLFLKFFILILNRWYKSCWAEAFLRPNYLMTVFLFNSFVQSKVIGLSCKN